MELLTSLAHDPRLLLVTLVAGLVSLLTTLNIAARPAAVRTGRVALAFTMSALFFMLTRFANLFYLPVLGAHVDHALLGLDGGRRVQALDLLYHQIQLIVVSSAVGALGAWLLLPTFIEFYRRGIEAIDRHKSLVRVLKRSLNPSVWPQILGSCSRPSLLGVKPGRLAGQPVTYLLVNVLATAIWTVGTLCAALASAREPGVETTALLLSGMVNAFAAIAFSVWVDPMAAVITDQAIKGDRPERDVTVAAVHLAAGNFLGALLGVFLLEPGTRWIQFLARAIGQSGEESGGTLGLVLGINLFVMLVLAAANMDRVSAVLTKNVATALSVFNVFFLITNLSKQVYLPALGSLRDQAVARHQPETLEAALRWVVFSGTVGVLIGIFLMPTFVEVYCKAVRELEQHGSMARLGLRLLSPRGIRALLSCLRRPTMFGVRWADIKDFPASFVWGNVLVVGITTVGSMAAIYAGALNTDVSRCATLLSSVVNGLGTITLGLIVNPMAALITDECAKGERPVRHIYTMSVILTVGMLIGTVVAQLLFGPATSVIGMVAKIVGR